MKHFFILAGVVCLYTGCTATPPVPTPALNSARLPLFAETQSVTASADFQPLNAFWQTKISTGFFELTKDFTNWDRYVFPYPDNGGKVSMRFTNYAPPLFFRAGFITND